MSKSKILLNIFWATISAFACFFILISIFPNINTKKQVASVADYQDIRDEDIEKQNLPLKTTLYFVGDIMMTRGVKSSVEKNLGGDYNKLFENLSELKNADILFGNLEGDVSDKGKNVGSKYSFRMEPSVLPVLKEAGFDIVSFANNHIGDWSMIAFKDTIERLNEIGILKTGAGINKTEAEDPSIIEKNGIKFGFLGFSDVGPVWMEAKTETPGILLATNPRLPEIIKNAKEKCDILIVSFHFGEEYKPIHNSRQETLAHTAIDSGADMVIGHHPHVIEDIEMYKDKPIVYSLGNFIFDQYFSKETMEGMLFIAKFENKNLVKTEQKIITLNKLYQPEGIFTKEELVKKELENSNCPKPKKEYSDMSLYNIGYNTALPDKTYIPKDLVELNNEYTTKNSVCITKETRDNLEQMLEKAKKDGYIIKAICGYRSYETQQEIYNDKLKKNQTNYSLTTAKAGYSEHQLGTTVDFTGESNNFNESTNTFAKTKESKWLKENAKDFGFVESYPSNKMDITGYIYEPWHYRYLGVENAQKIDEQDLTIKEFLN